MVKKQVLVVAGGAKKALLVASTSLWLLNDPSLVTILANLTSVGQPIQHYRADPDAYSRPRVGLTSTMVFTLW